MTDTAVGPRRDPSESGTAAGLVVFGDIAGSRRDATGSSRWLDALRSHLDERLRADRLARFEVTQGDEIQGLLKPDSDPLVPFLTAALDPAGVPTRWVAVLGRVDEGTGPATRRTGAAFVAARAAIDDAKRRRLRLIVATGEIETDRLLELIAPVLADLLGTLTPAQREVARPMLLEGARQVDVARRLGQSAASVSITAARARVASIARLATAVRALYAASAARVLDA